MNGQGSQCDWSLTIDFDFDRNFFDQLTFGSNLDILSFRMRFNLDDRETEWVPESLIA